MIFGPPKTRSEGFSLESQHDSCIFTFLQKNTKKRPELVLFWEQFSFKFQYFCEKKRSKTCFKKRCLASLKRPPIRMPGGPWTAPLAGAVFWTINNNSSKKSQQLLDFDCCSCFLKYFAKVVVQSRFVHDFSQIFCKSCIFYVVVFWSVSQKL